MRYFSNLESLRVLKLSDLESFRVRKSSIKVPEFSNLESFRAQSGDRICMHNFGKRLGNCTDSGYDRFIDTLTFAILAPFL